MYYKSYNILFRSYSEVIPKLFRSYSEVIPKLFRSCTEYFTISYIAIRELQWLLLKLFS